MVVCCWFSGQEISRNKRNKKNPQPVLISSTVSPLKTDEITKERKSKEKA